jgi:Ca2+-binding RTX toxin-like protein
MAMVRALIGALLLLGVIAPGAFAGTASESGNVVSYTGTSAADAISLGPATIVGGGPWEISPTGATSVLAGSGCSQDGANASCPYVTSIAIDGTGGNDTLEWAYLYYQPSIVALHGGAGDDRLSVRLAGGGEPIAGTGAGDVFGDTGTDTFVAPMAVNVTLDDQPNDGQRAMPSLNVHSDVENLQGSPADDQLAGSAAANVIDGGSGNDTLSGGRGDDTLIGNDGDDTIDARDGGHDSVQCGFGDDTVTADAIDTLSGCENVELPPAPPPVDPGTVGGGPTGATTHPKRRKLRRITSPIEDFWTGNHVDSMTVRAVPRHGRISLSCSKRGCPFRHARGTVRHGRAKLTPLFHGKSIPVGATLEVRITAPRRIGKVRRWKVRSTIQVPRPVKLCLPPGKAKPRHC